MNNLNLARCLVLISLRILGAGVDRRRPLRWSAIEMWLDRVGLGRPITYIPMSLAAVLAGLVGLFLVLVGMLVSIVHAGLGSAMGPLLLALFMWPILCSLFWWAYVAILGVSRALSNKLDRDEELEIPLRVVTAAGAVAAGSIVLLAELLVS